MHFAISKHSSTNWPQICGKKLGLIPVFVEAVDQTRAFCQLTKLEAPIFRSLEYSENNWMKCENYYGTCIYIDLKFDRGGRSCYTFHNPLKFETLKSWTGWMNKIWEYLNKMWTKLCMTYKMQDSKMGGGAVFRQLAGFSTFIFSKRRPDKIEQNMKEIMAYILIRI